MVLKMNICNLEVTSHGGVNLYLDANLAIVKNHALHPIIVYEKKCQKLNSPIIILEDDIVFSDKLLNNSNIIEKLLNSNYEYIRFYYLFDKRIHHLNNNFYISYENTGGTQGYFIRPNAAKKFVKKQNIGLSP